MSTSRGSISDGLSADFYGSTAGVASSDDLARLHVAVDGRQYLIDVRRYSRTILDSQSPQSDDAAEAGEKSLSRAGYWVREQTDWSHGAGQRLFDAPTSSRLRFESSHGVEVFERDQLSLLHDTALRHSTTETNVDCFAVGGYLYVVDANFLRFTNDPDVATPTFTSVDFTDNIVDWTTDGDRIYVTFGAALPPKVVNVGGTTVSTLGAETPDIIGYANGRLVAADGATLYELDSLGAKIGATDIRVDPRSSAVWTGITGAPSAIFVGLNAGDVGEIYAMTVDDATTALTAPVYAGGLPYGETVRCLAAYPPGNVVVIGTSKGLRIAVVDGLSLHFGERIDVDGGVNAVALRDRFAWFTWTNPRLDTTGVGRVDLSVSTSVDTFVPAYAEDVQADGITGTVRGVAVLQGASSDRERAYFAVLSSGVWGESDDLVAQGTVESGHMRFGVLPAKIFTSLEVHHEPDVGSVGAAITYDNGSSQFLGGGPTGGKTLTSLSAGSGGALSASLALLLTRDGTDATLGPTVRAWEMSALPRPRRVLEVILPILLYTRVEDLRGHEQHYEPLTEIRRFEGLAATSRLVTYQEGDDTRKVRVASVAVPEGGVRSWQREGVRWFETLVMLRLLSKEF